MHIYILYINKQLHIYYRKKKYASCFTEEMAQQKILFIFI